MRFAQAHPSRSCMLYLNIHIRMYISDLAGSTPCFLSCLLWKQLLGNLLYGVRSQRQPIFQDTLACTYSLVGLVQLLELGTKTSQRSTVGSTEYWHSGLKYTPRRTPASGYIVAFVIINRLYQNLISVPSYPVLPYKVPPYSNLSCARSNDQLLEGDHKLHFELSIATGKGVATSHSIDQFWTDVR